MNEGNRHEIHHSFNRQLIPQIYQYIQTADYDTAIKVIDRFYNLYSHTDRTGWLENQCNSWQALVYEEQGNYLAALALYQSAYRSLQLDDDLYGYKKLNIARVLHRLGENKQAIAELEPILQQSSYDSPQELLKLFECYLNCLEKQDDKATLGDRVSSKYEKLIAYLAREYNLDLTNISLLSLQDLKTMVRQMIQKNRSANQRYSQLVIQLSKVEADSDKKQLLEIYISKEKVTCYCSLAIAELFSLSEFDTN